MSGFKDVMKNGWHPKGKDGGKESWRGDNKGINTVAGWMGKGKDPNEAARSHQSAPLSTLKDPASFGPPPKHVAAHSGGLGAATAPRLTLQERREQQQREQEEANKPPPGPYRADTTGLSTAHLPKPPAFRPGQQASPTTAEASKPKPKLPPRLPPRQNSHPDSYSALPPPSYNEATQNPTPTTTTSPQSYVNQGALGRLGQAGVSVPGLNIGRDAPPVPPPPRQSASPYASPTSPPPPAEASRGPQLGELQSRFAKMSTNSTGGQAPATGTSWADKQAALKTAGNLRDDPSKVSASDVQSAATTANNFRERHGEQVATGWKTASGLNQKYGIGNKINSYASSSASPPPPQSPTQGGVGKKPPPPPPPKKKELTASSPGEPPPIPMSSKPRF